jgi:hypothetical protein
MRWISAWSDGSNPSPAHQKLAPFTPMPLRGARGCEGARRHRLRKRCEALRTTVAFIVRSRDHPVEPRRSGLAVAAPFAPSPALTVIGRRSDGPTRGDADTVSAGRVASRLGAWHSALPPPRSHAVRARSSVMPSREPLWLANPSYRPFHDLETRRTGSGFQAAMARAHSRVADGALRASPRAFGRRHREVPRGIG